MTSTPTSQTEKSPTENSCPAFQVEYTQFDPNKITFPQQPVEKNIPGTDQKYLSDEIAYKYMGKHGYEECGQLALRFPRGTYRVFKNVDSKDPTKITYSAVANIDEHDPQQKVVKAVLDGIQITAAARLAQHPLYNDVFGEEDDTPDKKWQFAQRDSTLKHMARQQRDKAKKIIPGRKPSFWVKLRPGSTFLVGIDGRTIHDWEKLVDSTIEIEAPLICFSSIFKGIVRCIQCHMVSGLVLRKIEKVNVDHEKNLAAEFRKNNPELYEKYQKSFDDFQSEGQEGGGSSSGSASASGSASGSGSTPTKTALVTPPPLPGTGMSVPAMALPAFGNAAEFSANLAMASLPARH